MTATDNVAVVGAVSNDAPAIFQAGSVTVVTFSAVDAAGNIGTATATVTIAAFNADAVPPVVTPPANITVAADGILGTQAGNGAIVAFLAGATATDNVAVVGAISNDAPAIFPAGAITTVTFSASDAAGNVGTATATVTINPFVDSLPPVVTPPANITIAADGVLGAPASNGEIVVFLAAAAATDNVAVVGAISNDAPATFPAGTTTTVTFSASDGVGNVGTATATVTVNAYVDNVLPVVTPPADITVAAEGAAGTLAGNAAIAAFIAGATATDNVGVVGAITHDAPATFPASTTTTVTFSATDAAGNVGTATATVTVNAYVGGPAATPVLTFAAIKTFRFDWTDIVGATHYKLLENTDGVSGFTQVGSDIAQGTQSAEHVVPLYARLNAQYILQTCDAGGCSDSATVSVSGNMLASIGYVKSANTATRDRFGYAVSLSGDGNTLVVGAYDEDDFINQYTGIGGAYIYIRNGSSWSQQAYLLASNAEQGDIFGHAVSLSDDGNTLVVGARLEESIATGVNGDQTDNSATNAGAAYVFTRSGTVWSQQAYLKASNTRAFDQFGNAVSLSGDGNTLVVAARFESGTSTGVNGDQTNVVGSAFHQSGAVYLFTRSGTTWTQHSYIKASNTDPGDRFGSAVSLSRDGNTLAVGAEYAGFGAAYVFAFSGTDWSQQDLVVASGADGIDWFGYAVALSADGATLAVGAPNEKSNATGINGDETDNSYSSPGAAYVFQRSAGVLPTWDQQAYIKASNTGSSDVFGGSLSLTDDGNTLVIGAIDESSNATGVGGDETNNLASDSGAVYVFDRSGSTWSQQGYVKASNTEASDFFGRAVSLSADGGALAVGADGEDSVATGIGGDQTDNTRVFSGAVYLY
ncbi:MAG: hypothetical protein JMN27_14460 [gamma proteobacterium endosymbiont of Lamellibrachia anaximandri]|nr:hypothetical protein [gamma proteobacterium endosymbiont of Lamellibrachia anaximandri]MBL3535016.1 hypothetical protein [gamma proteobacterium endosymbiont of Lamellibrachia anaximandri]